MIEEAHELELAESVAQAHDLVQTMGNDLARARLTIHGAVQGVGFRPFVYRLVTELGLSGWVNNSSQGVVLELEGKRSGLESFILRLGAEKPPRSFIQSLETSWLDPVGYSDFAIRESDSDGTKGAFILPDIAVCPDCLHDIFDPSNRRHLYPFTNCTNCGPRFSIIEALPYDRPNTSMREFAMCEACRDEYEDPRNRRFHAQPNACPICGPQVELWGRSGETLAKRNEAITEAAKALRGGKIVAMKGLGGFHLVVDARQDEAVRRLRELKHREEKPFAVMFPFLTSVREACEISELEERLLNSPEAPMVLMQRHSASFIAPSVAPGNPWLGVMLPYTPLHHLLLALLQFPIVATSGNISDEPICTDERDALKRLGDIANLFLVHNRPIVRHVDDSVVRVMAGREMVMRRARGYAPLPIQLKKSAPVILGVGAHLKNAVALSVGQQVFVSQHIGDLETTSAYDAFQRVIRDLEKLYETTPSIIAADAHPDYLSTKFALSQPGLLIRVQHHAAHIYSCMAENEIEPPALGIAWDGTGYGLDGTIWGGEFFKMTEKGFERFCHLRTFRLPGGEAAVREPRRSALGLLFVIFGDELFKMRDLMLFKAFSSEELALLEAMLRKNLNAPITSSAGRLFDAVAALIGLRQKATFEGQAAMELEFAISGFQTERFYPMPIQKNELDWEPMIRGIIHDVGEGISVGEIATVFHNSLVEAMLAVCLQAGEKRVVLSGGCFQNKYLTERAVLRLKEEGMLPYWHQRVSTNDGGIALGQIAAASQTAE